MIRVYIKDTEIEAPNIAIRLNKKVTDEKDFTSKGGEYSFTLTIPINKQLKALLDNLQDVQGINKFLSGNRYDSEITSDGATIIKGDFVVTKLNNKILEGFIVGENLNWVNLFGDLTLRDLDKWYIPYTGFGGYGGGILNSPTGVGTIEYYNTRNYDEVDVNVPLVLYGKVYNHGSEPLTYPDIPEPRPTTDNGYFINNNSELPILNLIPAPYYLKVIKRCFKRIGIQFFTDIEDNLKKIILPYVGDKEPNFNWGTLDTHRRFTVATAFELVFSETGFNLPTSEPLKGVIRLNLNKFTIPKDFYYKPKNVYQDGNTANYVIPRDGKYRFTAIIGSESTISYKTIFRNGGTWIAGELPAVNDLLIAFVKVNSDGGVSQDVGLSLRQYYNTGRSQTDFENIIGINPNILVGYDIASDHFLSTTAATTSGLNIYIEPTDNRFFNIDFEQINLSGDSDLKNGDRVALIAFSRNDSDYTSAANNVAQTTFEFKFISFKVQNVTSYSTPFVVENLYYNITENLPNIKIKDFIKDFITNYSLNIDVEDEIVSLLSDDKFYSNPEIVDITDYLVSDNPTITKYIDADNFKFAHKVDASDVNNLPEFGNKNINISEGTNNFNINSIYSPTYYKNIGILYRFNFTGILDINNIPVITTSDSDKLVPGDQSNLTWRYKFNYRLLSVDNTSFLTNNSAGFSAGIKPNILTGIFVGGLFPDYSDWSNIDYTTAHQIGNYQKFNRTSWLDKLSFSDFIVSKYFNNKIEEIIRTHKVTVEVNLPNYVYNLIQPNTTIKLENDLYKLIDISGFDPSNNNSSTITLIKII